jgi:hypothetical protein
VTNTTHPEPELVFAFEARIDVAPSERIGRSDEELLEITPVAGGTVSGPRLSGTVVGCGGDWSTTRLGVAELEARYLLRADDGALIDIVNRGYYREHDGYFRTTPTFRTDAPSHRWLAETVFVGMARDEDGQICIRFYELR